MSGIHLRLALVSLILVLTIACNRKNYPNENAPQPGNAARFDSRPADHLLDKEVNQVVPNEALAQESDSANLFFTYQRTPCYGKCPSYLVTAQKDGSILYEGRRNVEMIGLFQAKLTDEQMTKILDTAKSINFFSLADMYPEDGQFPTDLPSSIIFIQSNDYAHKVVNKIEAPESLISFEKYLENIFKQLTWIKID